MYIRSCMYNRWRAKNEYFSATRIIDAFKLPDHKTYFKFFSNMSIECTNNRILKSTRSAQLGQPAPKYKLDLYIPLIS